MTALWISHACRHYKPLSMRALKGNLRTSAICFADCINFDTESSIVVTCTVINVLMGVRLQTCPASILSQEGMLVSSAKLACNS